MLNVDFRISRKGTVTVFTLHGSLMGGPEATELKNKVHSSIEKGNTLAVVDISGVEFINSSGLGTLIGCATALRNAGGRMMISGASKKVLDLIRITKLSPVLETRPTLNEAVDSLKG